MNTGRKPFSGRCEVLEPANSLLLKTIQAKQKPHNHETAVKMERGRVNRVNYSELLGVREG